LTNQNWRRCFVKDKALSLEQSLDVGQVNPSLFSGRSLYLLPDGFPAQHAYSVLAETMCRRSKWALGWVVISGRRDLVLVRPVSRLLVMHVLHFPALIRPIASYENDLRPVSASEEELELATRLIDSACREAMWHDYRDDTSEKLLALIEAKIQGREVAPVPAEEVPILQFLDALKQSVQSASRNGKPVKPQARSPRSPRKKPVRRSA
jgi:DNA end-binding protein Ku